MSAHIRFDEGGATFAENFNNGSFKVFLASYVLGKRSVGRRLIVDIGHDDQAMIGKFSAFGEFDSSRHVEDYRMVKIRLRACVLSCQFKAGFSID